MEWEFTPEDVVKARAGYGLTEFRHDLSAEVWQNVPGDAGVFARAYHLIYDLCYALATDKDLDRHLDAYAYDPPTVQFLRELAPAMNTNVGMLGAILQRQIMDRVEAGMPLQAAIDAVADWHRRAVAESTPAAASPIYA